MIYGPRQKVSLNYFGVKLEKNIKQSINIRSKERLVPKEVY